MGVLWSMSIGVLLRLGIQVTSGGRGLVFDDGRVSIADHLYYWVCDCEETVNVISSCFTCAVASPGFFVETTVYASPTVAF